MPEHCPGEAFDQDAVLYRACLTDPPSDEDYLPHNESAVPQKKKKANPKICAGWGLSVWIDEQELAHARDHVMPWMKRRYIFKSSVSAGEGSLSSAGDNGHYTYWPYKMTDLKARAVLHLRPEAN